MNTAANRMTIVLFEGNAPEVADRANAWLAEQPAGVRIIDLQYNYQGTEWYEGKPLSVGEHGILLALTEKPTKQITSISRRYA